MVNHDDVPEFAPDMLIYDNMGMCRHCHKHPVYSAVSLLCFLCEMDTKGFKDDVKLKDRVTCSRCGILVSKLRNHMCSTCEVEHNVWLKEGYEKMKRENLIRSTAEVDGEAYCTVCFNDITLDAQYIMEDGSYKVGGYCNLCGTIRLYETDSYDIRNVNITTCTETDEFENQMLNKAFKLNTEHAEREDIKQEDTNQGDATQEDINEEDINEEDTIEDIINKPNHYHNNGIDVIGFAEMQLPIEQVIGFHRINVLKYVTRYDKKLSPIVDLHKARFYLDELIEAVESPETLSQRLNDFITEDEEDE